LQALFQSAQHIYEKREGSGSGSVSLTNGSGSGSGRPQNIRILRIRIRPGSPTLPKKTRHKGKCRPKGLQLKTSSIYKIEYLYYLLYSSLAFFLYEQSLFCKNRHKDINVVGQSYSTTYGAHVINYLPTNTLFCSFRVWKTCQI
jgi:hypothetical protein